MSSNHRQSQSQQRSAPDRQYVEGSITRIKVENIMTYDSVEFTTGPFLNVVIGPNGTGKSTIVCAICLGLAGKTSWLGRAQQPSDFIKYGCKKAKIELELYNPDGDNWVIMREINKNNTSTWVVNGRAAIQKSVEEIVSRLNIQVGNLTQFLPQEKVADFAKMTQQELLENTEKAVGGLELYDNHQKLKEARNTSKSLAMSNNKLVEQLEQERQKNARVEQDVKNYEEREQYLEQIKLLQMKRSWVEYEEQRQQYMVARDEQKRKAEELRQAQNEHSPLQKKLDAAKKEKENVDTELKNKTLALKDVAKKAQANGKEVDNLTDKFVELQEELNFKREQEQSRKKRLHDLKRQMESLQKDLASTEETENLQPAIDAVTRKMREVNQSMNQVHQQGERARMEVENCRREFNMKQRELQTIRDIENKRLELLRTKHRHTFEATMWLRENRHLFKGAIHDPIMLCVNMKVPKMAKYLENHINFNDMRAFVCETTEDFSLFMDLVRDQQNLKINAVKMPKNVRLEDFHPPHPIQRYKKFGFNCYLQELFTCPDAVMKYLCSQYRVHLIPVGDNKTKDLVHKIVSECPELNFFYTAANQYNIKKSRYGNSTSSRNSKLKDASLLTVSMDENRERAVLQELEECQTRQREKEEMYKELQTKSQEFDVKLNQLREDKKQLTTKKDLKKKLESQIQSKKETIRGVEVQSVNLTTEEERTNKKIKDINTKKYRNLTEYLENTRKCVQLSMAKVRLSLHHAKKIRDFTALEADIRERSQQLHHLEAAYDELKETTTRCREVAKKLLQAAKKATGTGENEELQENLKSYFEAFPNSLEDIDTKVHEFQSRADCTVQTDNRIVEEFRRREREIVNLEKQLEEKNREQQRHADEVQEAQQQWLGPLRELLARINESFSYFFRCLKCAGEVDLSIPEDPEEYGKYGIRIKVKFRDAEALRELTPHHQSGGERSVATVLYMMALQELTKCPFRCVDEINQGMDPINERKVFELVVKTVCRKSSSQYFLLTPKLLPDLEYADNMTVLCIYNGPHMVKHTDWRLRRFLRRRARIED